MVHVSRGTWTGSVFEPSWSQIHISSLNTRLRLTEIHWSSSAYDTRVTSKHHGVVFRVQCDFSEKAFLKPPTFLWQIWHFLQDNNEIKWRTMRFLLESHVYLRFLFSTWKFITMQTYSELWTFPHVEHSNLSFHHWFELLHIHCISLNSPVHTQLVFLQVSWERKNKVLRLKFNRIITWPPHFYNAASHMRSCDGQTRPSNAFTLKNTGKVAHWSG